MTSEFNLNLSCIPGPTPTCSRPLNLLHRICFLLSMYYPFKMILSGHGYYIASKKNQRGKFSGREQVHATGPNQIDLGKVTPKTKVGTDIHVSGREEREQGYRTHSSLILVASLKHSQSVQYCSVFFTGDELSQILSIFYNRGHT